jgi:hypothetical protein
MTFGSSFSLYDKRVVSIPDSSGSSSESIMEKVAGLNTHPGISVIIRINIETKAILF